MLATCGAILPAQAIAHDFGSLNTMIKELARSIETRPLFDPDRRPPPALAPVEPEPVVAPVDPPETAPVAIAPEPESWTLLGVVVGEGQDMIVVLDTTKGETFRLALGESRDGWELLKIEGRDATLKNDQKTFALGFPKPPEE